MRNYHLIRLTIPSIEEDDLQAVREVLLSGFRHNPANRPALNTLRDFPQVSELFGRHRDKMRIVDILVIRPSRDLGKLAGEFEPRLPPLFRYLTRGLGTRRTASPDIISLILFQVDYLKRLIEIGEEDATAQGDAIQAFLTRPVANVV